MPLKATSNSRLATTAFVGGILAFPFWVLSYSWVPFTFLGRESYAVMYVVVIGEAGGLLASLGAIGCGLIGRKHTLRNQSAPTGLPRLGNGGGGPRTTHRVKRLGGDRVS